MNLEAKGKILHLDLKTTGSLRLCVENEDIFLTDTYDDDMWRIFRQVWYNCESEYF